MAAVVNNEKKLSDNEKIEQPQAPENIPVPFENSHGNFPRPRLLALELTTKINHR